MICLWLSSRVPALAVDLGYAADGPVAMEMHQRLMHPSNRRMAGTTRMVLIHAEPDQWDHFATWCRNRSYVAAGSTQQDNRDAGALDRAAAKIRTELTRLANHPAYRGVGVRGVDRRALPARRCGDGRWWPTTRQALARGNGATFAVEKATLYPHTVKRGTDVFTVWSPDRDGEGGPAAEPGSD